MTRAGLGLGLSMSSFSDREQGFEGKFHPRSGAGVPRRRPPQSHARRMGRPSNGAGNVDDYARAVVKSDIDQPGDDDVLRKVSQDLAGSGLSVPLNEIRAKMDEFLAIARGQIEAGN